MQAPIFEASNKYFIASKHRKHENVKTYMFAVIKTSPKMVLTSIPCSQSLITSLERTPNV
jgi:hypothetical protein